MKENDWLHPNVMHRATELRETTSQAKLDNKVG